MKQTHYATKGGLRTTPERSRLMSKVRRSGTAPEVRLRKEVHRLGFRYRIDSGRGLPGTPDIVLKRAGIAIFADGCFWHGCPRHGSTPKTNADFWLQKIRRNRKRDQRVSRELLKLGWRVLRFCERDIRNELGRVMNEILLTANGTE